MQPEIPDPDIEGAEPVTALAEPQEGEAHAEGPAEAPKCCNRDPWILGALLALSAIGFVLVGVGFYEQRLCNAIPILQFQCNTTSWRTESRPFQNTIGYASFEILEPKCPYPEQVFFQCNSLACLATNQQNYFQGTWPWPCYALNPQMTDLGCPRDPPDLPPNEPERKSLPECKGAIALFVIGGYFATMILVCLVILSDPRSRTIPGISNACERWNQS